MLRHAPAIQQTWICYISNLRTGAKSGRFGFSLAFPLESDLLSALNR